MWLMGVKQVNKLAILEGAKMNTAPVQEATGDILATNFLTSLFRVKLDVPLFWTLG